MELYWNKELFLTSVETLHSLKDPSCSESTQKLHAATIAIEVAEIES